MILLSSRILLFLVFSFAFVRLIQRITIRNKKATLITGVVLCLSICSLTAIFPIENLFVHFKSAEEAFRYSSIGTIEHVTYGKSTCMVTYSNGNSTYNDSIIPLSERGYKLPSYYGVKEISHRTFDNGSFEVLQLTGFDDYYIQGAVILDDDTIQVFDCNGKEVFTIPAGDGRTTLFFAYAETYESEYWLSINGEHIVISTGNIA